MVCGWNPSIMMRAALAWIASATPRDAVAGEKLPSKPTPLAPARAAPCCTPCRTNCSKGIARLKEMYQMVFPLAFDASNLPPTGDQVVIGCSAFVTRVCASAILALVVPPPELEVLLVPQAATSR